MPLSRLIQLVILSLVFLCAAAAAQPKTKTSPASSSSSKAVSATLNGSDSAPKALQPRTLNELFQAARDDGHVNVIVTLDLGTTFQSEGQLSTAAVDQQRDRKSTRLNSSHVAISYAVFCLKKKKKKE